MHISKNTSDTFVTTTGKKLKKGFKNMNSAMLILRHALRLVVLNNLQLQLNWVRTKVLMDQEKHRNLPLKQLDCLKYLTRQGITVWGCHDEDRNLYLLLKCRADDIAGMQQWIGGASYQFHDIINEMIQLMATQLLQKLLKEIRSAEWYLVTLLWQQLEKS